jgi:peptidoglycan/xylan/chitin deacetylase (PgdA/CDA1 family)
MLNPTAVALRGKGLNKLAKRGITIIQRYGWTPGQMDRSLGQFAAVLGQVGCSATFPITGAVVERHPQLVRRYQDQGIEFAIHGYRHVDHSMLSAETQLAQLVLACEAFSQAGIHVHGFRCPYMRWNEGTLEALSAQGLLYDSSQALAWDVLDGRETPAYLRELSFSGVLPAERYPSLPRIEDNLVRIPYSMPDDEVLVERLTLQTSAQMSDLWLAILDRTYRLGELFVIGLHPERAGICQEPLTATLTMARSLTPSVWIARLDEIADWWKARSRASVHFDDGGEGRLRLEVAGPPGVSILVRGVTTDVPTTPWMGGYSLVTSNSCVVSTPLRPFVGVSADSPPQLVDFLREQGYLVEISQARDLYSTYLDQAQFSVEDERHVLDTIETADRPLVRLGRWPNGAHSALAVTGDIDALTCWDYFQRFLGR